MFELCIAGAIVGAIFHHWSRRQAQMSEVVVLHMPEIPEARIAGTEELPPCEEEPEILCSCHHSPIQFCPVAQAIDCILSFSERFAINDDGDGHAD